MSKNFSFENDMYMQMLNRQVLHMDQGACYSPEYLYSRNMCDYPSRVMQVVRAVFLDELPASQYGADMVFRSLLSGQGERWQNFGESPFDYLYCQLLGRELFAQKGFAPGMPEPIAADDECIAKWNEALPAKGGAKTAVFLDAATAVYCAGYADKLYDLLLYMCDGAAPVSVYETGFTHMAHGLLREGSDILRSTIARLEGQGIKRVITLNGQSLFCLKTLAPALGISHSIEVQDITDIANTMGCEKAYVYGGSFYTRYTGVGKTLSALAQNDFERPIKNSWEFQPALDGNKRVNELNIWQPPICAEYLRKDDEFTDEIFRSGLERINAIPHKQLIVCDSFAYKALKDRGVAAEYFLGCLS